MVQCTRQWPRLWAQITTFYNLKWDCDCHTNSREAQLLVWSQPPTEINLWLCYVDGMKEKQFVSLFFFTKSFFCPQVFLVPYKWTINVIIITIIIITSNTKTSRTLSSSRIQGRGKSVVSQAVCRLGSDAGKRQCLTRHMVRRSAFWDTHLLT